ncbi:MAG: hypothetical protein AAFZ07_07805 [Actinomycetota bacterium]
MRWWPFGRSEPSADAATPAPAADPEPQRGEVHRAPPSDWRRSEPAPVAIRSDIGVVQRQGDGWLASYRNPSTLGQLGHLVDDHGPIGVIRPGVVDDPDPAPPAPEQVGDVEVPQASRSRSWMPRSVLTVATPAPPVQRSVVSAPTTSRGAPRPVPTIEPPVPPAPPAAEPVPPAPVDAGPVLDETADVEMRSTVGVEDSAVAPTLDLAGDGDDVAVQRATSGTSPVPTTPPPSPLASRPAPETEARGPEPTEVRSTTFPIQRSASDEVPPAAVSPDAGNVDLSAATPPSPDGGGIDLPAEAPPAPEGGPVEQRAAPTVEAPVPEERPLLGTSELIGPDLAETPAPQPPSTAAPSTAPSDGDPITAPGRGDAAPSEPTEIRPTIAGTPSPTARPLGLGAPLVQRSAEGSESGRPPAPRATSADSPPARDAHPTAPATSHVVGEWSTPTSSAPTPVAPVQPGLQRGVAESPGPAAPEVDDPTASRPDEGSGPDEAPMPDEAHPDPGADPVEVPLVGERALMPTADTGSPPDHEPETPLAPSTPPIQRALDDGDAAIGDPVLEPPALTPVGGGTTSWQPVQRATPAPSVVRPIVSQRAMDGTIGSLPTPLGGGSTGRSGASPDPVTAPAATTATPSPGSPTVQRFAGAPTSSPLAPPMLGAPPPPGRPVESMMTASDGVGFASAALGAGVAPPAAETQLGHVHGGSGLQVPMLQRHVDGSSSFLSPPQGAAREMASPLVAERTFELPADLTMVDHDGSALGSFGEPGPVEPPANDPVVQRHAAEPGPPAAPTSSSTSVTTLQREEAPAAQEASGEAAGEEAEGEGSDEALVERIYDRVQWRLRRELLLDRERSGRLIDRRW